MLLEMLADLKRFPFLRRVDIQLSAYKDMTTKISSRLLALINKTPSAQLNLSVTVLDGVSLYRMQ